MTFDPEKISKSVDLVLKLEIHALLLIASGAMLTIKGHSDVGQPIIAAGLVAFRGNRQ